MEASVSYYFPLAKFLSKIGIQIRNLLKGLQGIPGVGKQTGMMMCLISDNFEQFNHDIFYWKKQRENVKQIFAK